MFCIMHECLAIVLELLQSMDHSFAATCSVCNGLQPASKSGPTLRPCQTAAQMCRLRAWTSSYTIRPLLRKGPRACSEPKAAGTAEIRKSGKLDPNCWNFF